MREHVVPLARQALDTLSKLYQFKPTGPILVEMFPEARRLCRAHDWPARLPRRARRLLRPRRHARFAARAAAGQFSWEATLWHEMAHVISLQMSNNRVPRWLSEGHLAVRGAARASRVGHATWRCRSRRRSMRESCSSCATFNEGFSDPRMTSLVYHQASLVVEHLIDTYGEPAWWRLLRAYGKGLETDAAFKEAFNATLDDIQASFDAKLEKDYADLRRALKTPEIPEKADGRSAEALAADNPGSFGVQMTLGAGALRSRRHAAPRSRHSSARRSWFRRPTATQNPNAMIAPIATKQGDTARAIRALEAVVKVDSSDVESARTLARLVAQLGDEARTAAAYERRRRARSVRRAGAVGRRPLRVEAEGRPACRPGVPLRACRQARPTRRPRMSTWPKRTSWRGSWRRETRDARGARNRAVVRARAGSAAQNRYRPARRGTAAP